MAANGGNSWADQWDPEPLPEDRSKEGSGASSASKFDKTKAVASTGMKKVKDGASAGFSWIKDKCNKKPQK